MEKNEFHGVGQVVFQKWNTNKETDEKEIYNRGHEQIYIQQKRSE